MKRSRTEWLAAMGPGPQPAAVLGTDTSPLRAELFSAEELARHARGMAMQHIIGGRPARYGLLERLDANEQQLRAFNQLSVTTDAGPGRITPAAEWLLDNFYLIEDQVQMARRHLPPGYIGGLPCLAKGTVCGMPRAYAVVLELILHVDAQVDAATLNAFVTAYQSACPLTIGELWALPIMLRLGLIENLQRITARQTQARADADLAQYWVERLRGMAEESPSRMVIMVAEMAQADLPVTSSFVGEFCQILARQSPVLHLARTWLEQRLGEHGLSIEHLSHQESQRQAADQVSVSHSITSLRFLGAMDWKVFVEGQSQMEALLRGDPSGVYPAMDFATRDHYRHVVESLARHSQLEEADVARQAIELATDSMSDCASGDRRSHVGYYLIGEGLEQLETATQVRWPLRRRASRLLRCAPMSMYAGGILAATLLLGGGLLWQLWALGVATPVLWLGTVVLLLAVSQLAVELMNGFVSLWVKPNALPRIDFSTGIEPESRTVVAVPTMLQHEQGIGQLIETLEIHFLANQDACLHFALLTDVADAPHEVMPADAALIEQARAGITQLNAKYPGVHGERFFLFNRSRKWNASEGVWMGHERKRGKLADFNALLRGGPQDGFSAIVGDPFVLQSVRYVITMDTDTRLPREAAAKLVGAMAHPLNRPMVDSASGIVTQGYGILQPRIGISLAGARASLYARLGAGDVGIDPYTRQVSDVYQDVFGEGSFIGKGIYDVDAFRRATEGRLPENTVLSHDLLEGCYVRSGLLSDVELYESHPSRYDVDVARRHRWIRGDWQILQWLWPRVAVSDGPRVRNPLSALSRWKIFDNLRRSLVVPALLLVLLCGWMVIPQAGALLTGLIGIILALPAALRAATGVLSKATDLPWAMHLRVAAGAAARQAGLILLSLVFLPYDAFVHLDAIGRTLVRMLITGKRRLQWQSSGDAEAMDRVMLTGFYRSMWIAPAVAVATAGFLVASGSIQLYWAFPLLALWMLSPAVAWWLSRPIVDRAAHFSPSQSAFLQLCARKHWHYFETFVTAEENWLPPDNMQEQPTSTVAARTSPTNIGLALLANLAARDFGYLSTTGLIRRTRDTLATLQRMERHRKHFYNWYDTRTLQPLLPLYVSSVDSGNLAGHLLVLAAGLREQSDAGKYTENLFAGIRDTVAVVVSVAGDSPELKQLRALLEAHPEGVQAAIGRMEKVATAAGHLMGSEGMRGEEASEWARALQRQCADHLSELRQRAARMESSNTGYEATLLPSAEQLGELEAMASQCEELAAMDFAFLFDSSRNLFRTGFNVGEWRSDPGHYDLLASEARQCSYVAIALGQVPQDHWFALGRLLVAARGQPALVSWSGSMFEYLMPLLVMPGFANTLLDQTCKAAVSKQIAYGHLRAVPWGISESAYNRTDAQLNYQYRAFGVPGLGLKRGLIDDLVIAPYASALALMVDPIEACSNLQRLAKEGRMGRYGFYEAVDYTPARLPPGTTSVTICSYMVHHQGMSLLALDSVLLAAPMQRRFMACPPLKATSLLLQERLPRAPAGILSESQRLDPTRIHHGTAESTIRVLTDPHTPVPEIHLLSNGRYHVAISSAGAGYSRWRDLALTRWREDATCDNRGWFVYLQDADARNCGSTTFQPTCKSSDGYEAVFSQARAEFRVLRDSIEVHTRISVSPEDDVELRRITLTNHSDTEQEMVLTSYVEVVLAPQGQDEAHPGFSNLFVQTEFVPESSAVLATRRARSSDEQPPWLLHMLVDTGPEQGELSCETDRARFIGRGGSLAAPAAMSHTDPLSNTVGSVLDPVAALRRRVVLPAHGKVVVYAVLGASETREQALSLLSKYNGARMAERAFDLAWVHSQVVLHQLDASEAEVQLYARMAGSLIHANPSLRAHPAILANNQRGKSGLWSYGISGDAPLVLVRVTDTAGMELVGQMIRAHAYWRMKGLAVELVIVNENISLYYESLHQRINDLIASGPEAQLVDRPGGVFVRRMEHIPGEDYSLIQAAARIVLMDTNGTLAEQVEAHRGLERVVPPFTAKSSDNADTKQTALHPHPGSAAIKLSHSSKSKSGSKSKRHQTRCLSASRPDFDFDSDFEKFPNFPLNLVPLHPGSAGPQAGQPSKDMLPARELIFDNGTGGFTPDGNEYVITLHAGESSPMPWVNVIANPYFGTVVSERGSAYTWVENAREFRLTPWHNDAVEDPSGEAIYIRDEATGKYWSPTPSPACGTGPYVIRHGFGYTVFEHTEDGIASELWVYVAVDAPVKFSVLTCRNVSGRPRRLSVTGYCEWVLADQRRNSLLHVRTELDPDTGALLARNPYHTDFAERIAFIDLQEPSTTITGDRTEFIGRNGRLSHPAAMRRSRLSGKVGAGLDPCGAVQVSFDLPAGGVKETRLRIGVGRSRGEVHTLIRRFRGTGSARSALEAVWEYWNRTLGAINVDTPDASVNVMTNGWLLYQTLSCRMWGRSGFYQSGGAYGFRDQLQDSMALVHAEPALVREHLLRAAGRQFREGDVQHWWHPPAGRGVRTHFSDDYLWLPYVTCHYVTSVGDSGVLDAKAGFIESRKLRPEEESLYELPNHSEESASLYQHCVLAIENGLRFGPHGLPLIGCGDWNDGMNQVGPEGRGESVWLGFFLFDVLQRFAVLADGYDDQPFAERCRSSAAQLQLNIESHAWDGDWYRRAYFDNGVALGSTSSPECQIDSLPQSWAVLSGAGDAQRAHTAMESVQQRLIHHDTQLVQLFTPPFDKGGLNPGYIKGYIPGVRENGGQYTHAAIWVAMAFARMGDYKRAWEVFHLINPINHAATAEGIERYKAEPYVVAADVYAVEPHMGRGGWSWYTGSAAWMYRLLSETLLGIHREGDHLRLQPCPPPTWDSYKIHYRYYVTVYHITLRRSTDDAAQATLTVDGVGMPGNRFLMHNDQQEHGVEFRFQ